MARAVNTLPATAARCARSTLRPRCPLFGYALDEMKLDGQYVRQTFLRPETQSKLGTEGYDAGAKILADFIKEQVAQFVCDDLDPAGPADHRTAACTTARWTITSPSPR